MHELSPFEWAVLPLKRFADFSGRATRAEYWWFALFYGLAQMLFAILDGTIGIPVFAGFGPLRLGVGVVFLVPTYAVTVRRLHDTNTSGWLVLARLATFLFFLAPALHLDALDFSQMPGWSIALMVILGIGWVCAEITLFVFLIIRGTDGPNRFGPDPYGPDELEEVFA